MSAPTLVEFLTARLGEDDGRVDGVYQAAELDHVLPEDQMFYVDRLSADVAAKRRIVEMWQKAHGPQRDTRWGRDVRVGATFALHALATVYADHPDYRQEWKP